MFVVNKYISSMTSDLRTEIRQNKAFGSLEEEAWLNLKRTTDRLEQPVLDVLKGANLTPTQYNVLRILRGAGSEGLTAGDVGDRMLTRSCDVTRLLDRLEVQGLVQRSRTAADRRVITVTITEEGMHLLQSLDEPIREVHQSQLRHLGPGRLRELIDLLEEARQGG